MLHPWTVLLNSCLSAQLPQSPGLSRPGTWQQGTEITLGDCWLLLKFCSTPSKDLVGLLLSKACFSFPKRNSAALKDGQTPVSPPQNQSSDTQTAASHLWRTPNLSQSCHTRWLQPGAATATHRLVGLNHGDEPGVSGSVQTGPEWC